MKASPRNVPALLIAVLLAAPATPGTAQIRPDSPIINFRLPMFGDDGNPVWDLRGNEGIFVSENEVKLEGVRLLVFAKDQPDRVETTIASPAATLYIEEEEVHGDEAITVTGSNYVITGEGWTWNAGEDRVVIDDNVKITFAEELSSLLVVQ